MKSGVRDQIKEFWNNSGNYDQVTAHGIHSGQEKEFWKMAFTQFLGTEKKLKILDMGTGSGFLALLLAEMQYEVTGADWAENMLEKAKMKIKDTDLSVDFVREDAENLSFNDNLFDAVVSRHMLWTLTNPQKAISEWARVTKNGGKIIVDIPTKAVGKHHFSEEIGKELPFYNGVEPDEMVKMLENAGFVNVEMHYFKSEDRQTIIMTCNKP